MSSCRSLRAVSSNLNRGYVLVLLLSSSGLSPLGAETIWIEGEAATRKSVRRSSWYDGVKADVLSGGAWLSHFHRSEEGTAEFKLTVGKSDRFTFWVRANHIKSALSYRIDGGEWQRVDFDKDLRGAINIAKDNKPDLRFLCWVKAGVVRLERGDHRLQFRFHSANSNHGALDCFAFSSDGFVPSGKTRPSARNVTSGPSDWFPFVADHDPFSKKSVTDVSHLVEAPAGKHGFLRADGKDLRFERGETPVKFWGIGSNLAGRDEEEMERSARWYRKHGINLVRQHTVIADVGLLGPKGFDPERLDRYDRWFATLKRHGIYTCWSMVYPHHGAFVRASDGISKATFEELDASDGRRDGSRQPVVANDFINLDRELQDLALRYFRALLEHRNPHTGLRYKDDPALAIVEFQNESNVFFHTLNDLRKNEPPRFARALRQGFFRFAKEKYGSKVAVKKAWRRWDRDDRWEKEELGILVAFHWGADGPRYEYKGATRRCGDYLEFLAGIQRGYYARRQKELRDIGFRGVTVTTAWKGIRSSSLPNLWCDAAGDMIDRHNYFGGGAGRHRIVEGDVNTATHLSRPGRGLLNLGLFQIDDKPFAVSEWSHMPPNPWKAEAAPLLAFYGMGLQGWDASCHFATSASRFGGGWPNLSKYVSHTPHYMGQFPALALAIHRGHVAEGDTVALRRVSHADVFSGTDTLGQSIGDGDHDVKKLGDNVVTPPELLAAGRVTVAFDDGDSRVASIEQFWKRKQKIVRSTTGELLWRYGDRVVEIRTPKTQGILGFAGGKSIELPAARVEVKTKFVSLILTPLDDLPLETSRSVLITALARDKQAGSEFSADGAKLLKVGAPPLLLEPVEATIEFSGDRIRDVRPLDIYGVPRAESVPLRGGGAFHIDGRYRTIYYHVRRGP